jgi:hypothetical protein
VKGFTLKAFVQSKETQLYLTPRGDWAREQNDAMRFNNASEALEYCLERHIYRVRIILNFGKNEYDLDLDLEKPWKRFFSPL